MLCLGVSHPCNLSSQEAGMDRPESEASLGYIVRPSLNKQKIAGLYGGGGCLLIISGFQTDARHLAVNLQFFFLSNLHQFAY